MHCLGLFGSQHLDNLLDVLVRQSLVEQTRHRLPQQTPPSPQDVRSHRQSDQRVEHEPPGQGHCADADDDTG